MRLIWISSVGRMVLRVASASAVRIALGATLTTPQPIGAVQLGVDTSVAPFVRTASPATSAHGATSATDAVQAPDLVGVEPGPGLG
jgi:hypothetical protein